MKSAKQKLDESVLIFLNDYDDTDERNQPLRGWSISQLAANLHVTEDEINDSLLRLLTAQYVFRHHCHWFASTHGKEAVREDQDARRDDPFIGRGGKAWVALVRAGITSSGRETRVENAAIPDRLETPRYHDSEKHDDAMDWKTRMEEQQAAYEARKAARRLKRKRGKKR